MKILSMRLVRRLVPLSEVAEHVIENLRDVDRDALAELKSTLREYNAKRKLWASEIRREEIIERLTENPPTGDPEAECGQ